MQLLTTVNGKHACAQRGIGSRMLAGMALEEQYRLPLVMGLGLRLMGHGTLELSFCYCFSRTLGLRLVQLSREAAVNCIHGDYRSSLLRSFIISASLGLLYLYIYLSTCKTSIDSRLVSDI